MQASLMNIDATVYQLVQAATSGDDKYIERYETSGTAFRCAIQPADATDTAMTDGHYGRSFKMFCDRSVTLKVGDKILAKGREFFVQGVQDYDFGRFVAHKEVILSLPIIQAEVIDVYVRESGDGMLGTEDGARLGTE